MQLVVPSAVAKAVSMLMAICTIILSVSFFMAIAGGLLIDHEVLGQLGHLHIVQPTLGAVPVA